MFSVLCQCDQIGRYLKVFRNKLSLLSSPNICQLFGPLSSRSLLSKITTLDSFRAGLEKLGFLLIPASGHSVRRSSVFVFTS